MLMSTKQAELMRRELLVVKKMMSNLPAKLDRGQGQNTLPERSMRHRNQRWNREGCR